VLSNEKAVYVLYLSPEGVVSVRLVEEGEISPRTQEPGTSVIRAVKPEFVSDLHRRSFDRACLLRETVELLERTFLQAYLLGVAREATRRCCRPYDNIDCSTD
jgi:hypothetical protein